MKEKILDFKNKIANINVEKLINDEKNIFLKKNLSEYYLLLKQPIDANRKKEIGEFINKLKNDIEEIVKQRVKEIKNDILLNIKYEFNPLIQLESNIGSQSPIYIIIDLINNFFKKLNFNIINGEEVTQIKYNFDNLNVPLNHPSRSESDTFYINDNLMLRAHCTAQSAKYIENSTEKEIKMVSYGNVYRKDDDDATHSHQFNQVDIIWINKNNNVANLKWLINSFLEYLFGKDIKTRYRLSYFPFTEPSFEVDISCFKCQGSGCNICKQSGWIEILGAGIFNKKVIEKANLDPNMVGLAMGVGIDRLVMLKYNISDIRIIYNNDFRILKQFKGKTR